MDSGGSAIVLAVLGSHSRRSNAPHGGSASGASACGGSSRGGSARGGSPSRRGDSGKSSPTSPMSSP